MMLGTQFVARKTCPVCDSKFYAPPAQVRRLKPGGTLTCSKRCSGALRTGSDNSNWKPKEEKVCATCGKTFHIHKSLSSRRKYCSKPCNNNRIKPQKPIPAKQKENWRPWNWKGGDINRNCETCGKVFLAKRSAISKGQGRFCSMDCWSVRITGIMQGKQHTTARGGKREDLNNQYFRSSWEANWARYLNWLISLGEIKSWEFEPDTFVFEKISRGNRFYTPDFKVFDRSGAYEYHEIKGYMDDKSRVKLKRMEMYYPNEKIILIDADQYRAISKQVRSLIPNWESSKTHSY